MLNCKINSRGLKAEKIKPEKVKSVFLIRVIRVNPRLSIFQL